MMLCCSWLLRNTLAQLASHGVQNTQCIAICPAVAVYCDVYYYRWDLYLARRGCAYWQYIIFLDSLLGFIRSGMDAFFDTTKGFIDS